MPNIQKGLCTISMWEKFMDDLKRQFFSNNVYYKSRCKLRELKKIGKCAIMSEFTILCSKP